MLALLFFITILLPYSAHSEFICPDGNKCSDGTQCCSVSPTAFNCCEVRKHLMEEMEVAGREHLLGMPSEFGSRMVLMQQCRGSSCGNGFCCSHLGGAQCCRLPHQCCKVGFKCCGGVSSWCCPWKLACSAAHGYCISGADGKGGWILLVVVSVLWLLAG